MNKMRKKKGEDEEKLKNGAKEIDSWSGISKSQKLRKRQLILKIIMVNNIKFFIQNLSATNFNAQFSSLINNMFVTLLYSTYFEH